MRNKGHKEQQRKLAMAKAEKAERLEKLAVEFNMRAEFELVTSEMLQEAFNAGLVLNFNKTRFVVRDFW